MVTLLTVLPATVGYEDLRDVPLRDLVLERDRVERLLAERTTPTSHSVPLGRDLAAEALRSRERAVVAEIRRRPGGVRLGPSRALGTASRPG